MTEDRCVCCGAVIPEGRMVCPNCLVYVKEGERNEESTSEAYERMGQAVD